jgi:two-component system LytT family response regulator
MSPKVRAVIVDDEALARRGLELRLGHAPDFEIVAQCESARDALPAIREHKPELLFLDIQMPGLSGFDLVAQIPRESLPLVVFVTAYDQYAIRAFEARALDYLLKPIDDERFTATLEKVRAHLRTRDAAEQRDRLVGLIAEISGCGEVALEELLERGRAAGDYMCIHASGQTHILRGTMKELEDILDPRLFQRVHRSTIVNLRRVKSLRAHMNGEYFLTLEGAHELKMSRTYRDKVEYFLKGSHQG